MVVARAVCKWRADLTHRAAHVGPIRSTSLDACKKTLKDFGKHVTDPDLVQVSLGTSVDDSLGGR